MISKFQIYQQNQPELKNRPSQVSQNSLNTQSLHDTFLEVIAQAANATGTSYLEDSILGNSLKFADSSLKLHLRLSDIPSSPTQQNRKDYINITDQQEEESNNPFSRENTNDEKEKINAKVTIVEYFNKIIGCEEHLNRYRCQIESSQFDVVKMYQSLF